MLGGGCMDVNSIIQIISGVGFPIACCIAMGLFIVWDKKSRREDMKENAEKQNEVLDKLNTTISENTKLLNQLMIKVEQLVLKQ